MPDGLLRCQPTQTGGIVGLGVRNWVAMLSTMEATTTVWLVKPEAPQDAQSITFMRRAIEQDGTRPGSLVAECLEAARARGLTREQTYVFLAYQALLWLEETHQRHIFLSDIAPFLEPVSPHSAATEGKAPAIRGHIGMQVKWLVRSAVDQALRIERAVAELMRISPAHDSRVKAPAKARAVRRVNHSAGH
jgi:hypothetical protein